MLRRFSAGLAVALVAVAALGVTASSAAAEIQPPEEAIVIVFRSKQGGEAYVQLFPDRGFAKLYVRRGVFEPRRGHSAAVILATEIPKGPLTGPFSAQFGRLGTVSGEFVADPPKRVHHQSGCKGPSSEEETGDFVGRVEFRGFRGFIDLHASHAFALVQRSAEMVCEKGKADEYQHVSAPPDQLFSYAYYPRGFFGSAEALLEAPAKDRKLETVLTAIGYGETSEFTAVDYGTLEAGLLATLVVEAGTSDPDALRVRGLELPESATVEPPYPFAGKATYVPRTGRFRGDLTASFPGLSSDVPLARPSAEPYACALYLQNTRRVCR